MFQRLFDLSRSGFKQQRSFERAKGLALSQLVSMGRRTIAGLICTQGCQFEDWTAAYRMFSRQRIESGKMFSVVEEEVLDQLPQGAPLVVAMDDTLLRKRGKKIPGAGWQYDPLGPKFRANLVWGQRMLQLSAALPLSQGVSPARMIPVATRMIPKIRKPRKNASKQVIGQYLRNKETYNTNNQAVLELEALRQRLDHRRDWRFSWVVADGNFTNKRVLQKLPERMVYIGRIRSDASLYFPPEAQEGKGAGRKRSYGDRTPTPEELLRDESAPWESVKVHVAGHEYEHQYKSLAPVLWRSAGANRPLRLIVIAPVKYTFRKGQKERRQPAYLICTDPDVPVEQILQAYYWRWDIEVNFRDEKQLIGAGQAQVRSPASVENVPAFAVASYAMLLAAAVRVYGKQGRPDHLPTPAWSENRKGKRATTHELIKILRQELWSIGMRDGYFSGFAQHRQQIPKPEKFTPMLMHAVMNA